MKQFATLSPAEFDIVCKLHQFFLNKSDVMILTDSSIVNHRVPTKADNLLVINLEFPKSFEIPLVSWQLSGCTSGMDDLRKIQGNYNVDVYFDDQTDRYYFSGGNVIEVSLPRLNDQQRDNYRYDDVPSCPRETYAEHGIKDYGVFLEPEDSSILELLRSAFAKAKHVDILVKDEAVIGVQYEDVIIRTNNPPTLSTMDPLRRKDADYMLRSHAFLYFKKHISDIELSLIKDETGNYWLITRGHFLSTRNPSKKAEESIDVVPPDYTAYEHIECLAR